MAFRLEAQIGADGSGFFNTLNAIEGRVKGFSKGLTALKGTLGAVFTAWGAINVTREIIDRADKLLRLNETLHVGIENLQEWAHAAYMADSNLDTMVMAYRRFATARRDALRDPGGEAADALRELGISISDIRTQAPELTMLRIAEATEGAAENSTSLAAAMKLLGKSADEVLPTLKKLQDETIKAFPKHPEYILRNLAEIGDQAKTAGQGFKYWGMKMAGNFALGWNYVMSAFKEELPVDLKWIKAVLTKEVGLAEAWEGSRREIQAIENRFKRGPLAQVTGGLFGVGQGIGPKGGVASTGAVLRNTQEELVAAAEAMRDAQKEEDDLLIKRLSLEQKIATLTELQVGLRKEMKSASYDEYAILRVALAKASTELYEAQTELEKRMRPDWAAADISKVKIARSTPDELVQVGNFLGSNMRGGIDSMAQEQIKIGNKQAFIQAAMLTQLQAISLALKLTGGPTLGVPAT